MRDDPGAVAEDTRPLLSPSKPAQAGAPSEAAVEERRWVASPTLDLTLDETTPWGEEQQRYLQIRRLITSIQHAVRRRKWRRLLGSKIPRIVGPCGMVLYPIHDSAMVRIGLEGPSGKQYRGHALCLSADSAWRLRMVMCVESSAFGSLTLGAIVGNCMLMAVQGPPGSAEAMFGAREYEHLELGFTIFFSAELLLKTLAMGFYGHEHAFLSDPWNRLDLGIVLLGWLPIFFPALNTKYCAARPPRPPRLPSPTHEPLLPHS